MAESIHFIGIGGIGVSALAQLALARGARVSGSDSSADPGTNAALGRLVQQGARFYSGHQHGNVAADVDLVVATAAAGNENPEILEAHGRGIRVTSRAEYLGELMAAHKGPKIAVAGTHGKTTTTGMIGVMLQSAGLDPTVFVGGEVLQLGGNVRIGRPDGPFVAEACEAYDSFLYLKPDIAIVTNVEADHLDHYGTEAGVFSAFAKFLTNVSVKGSIVACGDDQGVRRLMGGSMFRSQASRINYGLDAGEAELSARQVRLGAHPAFVLTGPLAGADTDVRLSVPGRHNVENALAAAAVGRLLGLPTKVVACGLAAFHGAERRQDILGEVAVDGGTALVIDDYAHHPTEIRATIEALRSAHPERRMIAVFQPHLYSRTRDFLREFARELAMADALVVTEVYAARERPIEGVRAEQIAELAGRERPGLDVRYAADQNSIPSLLAAMARPGDLVVIMGAGDIREQGEAFVRRNGTGEATA